MALREQCDGVRTLRIVTWSVAPVSFVEFNGWSFSSDYMMFESTVAALVVTFSASAGMKCEKTHCRLSAQDQTVTDTAGWSTQRSIKQQKRWYFPEDWSKTNQTKVNIDFTFLLHSLSFLVCNIYYDKTNWKPQQEICIWIQRRQKSTWLQTHKWQKNCWQIHQVLWSYLLLCSNLK